MSFCDNLTAEAAKNWCRAEIARLWPVRRMIGRVRITELCDTVRFYSDLPVKRRGMWFKRETMVISHPAFGSITVEKSQFFVAHPNHNHQ